VVRTYSTKIQESHKNCGVTPPHNPSTRHRSRPSHNNRRRRRPKKPNKNKANLVLCGHRHRPWKWQIEKMQVIHAGSISCERLRGFFLNSYNVTQIKNKKINAKLKIVGGGYVDFKEIIKHREILQASDISQHKSLTQ